MNARAKAEKTLKDVLDREEIEAIRQKHYAEQEALAAGIPPPVAATKPEAEDDDA